MHLFIKVFIFMSLEIIFSFSFSLIFFKKRERLKTQGLSSYLHVLKMVKVTDGAKNTMKRICFICYETEAPVLRPPQYMTWVLKGRCLLQIALKRES